MTRHLFLGGPLAGWHESYGGLHNVRYPIMPPMLGFESAADILSDRVHAGIGTYTRRRVRLPGWRIALVVYTCDDDPVWRGPAPRIPIGTELPGVVWGVRLPMRGTGAWRYNLEREAWQLEAGLVRAEVPADLIDLVPDLIVARVAEQTGVPLPPEATGDWP